VNILALTDLSTWPLQVLSHLEKHYARFLGWGAKSTCQALLLMM
jgi:hypothetical protein